jgi:outer membrane protein insertion porin family
MRMNLKQSFLLSILALIICWSDVALASVRITQIVVNGNERIESATVKSYLGLKVGDDFSSESQTRALKALYGSSMFENIELKYDGGKLTVTVKENPMVSAVVFKGNSKIKSGVFSKELFTQAGESMSNARMQTDVDKIIELYKRSGRFSVKVLPEIEKLSNNRVKVIFNITEGPKTAIRHIYFVGNENYSSNDLRSVIMTKETAWYKFMDSNDTYDPDRMDYDKELLRNFYQSVGFADVNIISATAELSPTKDYFIATYSINEGSKYNLGEINVQNNIKEVNTNVVRKLVTVKKRQTFNMNALEGVASAMSEQLNNLGYAQVNVVPELVKLADKKLVNVTFVVQKTDKAFISKINITGNVKTSEKVIRREFKIAEGDAFNREQINKGERGIRNLDYFEKVDIKVVQAPGGASDRYDLNVGIQEKSTASIGLEYGYSSAEGFFGGLSFAERNFLGTGKHLDAAVRRSNRRFSWNIGVTETHFLDKDLVLGVSLFSSEGGTKASSNFSGAAQPYESKTIGGRLLLGYDITEALSHQIVYTLKQDRVSDVPNASSAFLSEQAGTFVTSAIGHTLTYDKLDSRIVPKNGYILSVGQEYSGIGGDSKYLKHEADAKFFKSFFHNQLTFKVTGEVGVIHGINHHQVHITERFSVGDYNLRAFAPSGIGPRVKTGNKDALNGQKYYASSVEMIFPIGLPEEMNVRGAIFTDIAALWDFDMVKNSKYSRNGVYNDKTPRASVGAGIMWNNRVMPIRIDWAIPIRYKKYDDQQRFHIRMSNSF